MLDKRMIYTCAYWLDAENLDAARETKLDLICRKLGLEPGMRLLDIGCGWGGFAQFMTSRYDVQVTGISPAIEQVTLARENTVGLPVTILQKVGDGGGVRSHHLDWDDGACRSSQPRHLLRDV